MLTACASEPVTVTEREPVLPPASYLQPCDVSLGNGTIGEALQGLRATVECDRADKAALRAWRTKHDEDDGDEPRDFLGTPGGG
ncbi:Rz1-like lysis system protein LysC [Chromohalobacter nigrandesensis]|uniref:Rz1-like lysis system protein LysC n=1 Tax=Chromohalobacter nigrandesensis TaxID=119863 RepID=UPI001FF69B74|nr:hypothetical protein [Chromohalobacter nigrandesensis]MCK0743576.1 hypothetical protein [Chromohalobacter nigrandesensis]